MGLPIQKLGQMNVALNGVPDAGSGPLAFAHVQTGSGLRAAIVGESSGRIRLALAVAFSALAILGASSSFGPTTTNVGHRAESGSAANHLGAPSCRCWR